MLAEIFGMDGVVVLIVVVAVLFGGTQIPKLARSLGIGPVRIQEGTRRSARVVGGHRRRCHGPERRRRLGPIEAEGPSWSSSVLPSSS